MLIYNADTAAYEASSLHPPARKFRVINSGNIGKDFKGQILNLLYENAFDIRGYHCFSQPLFDNELNSCVGTVCMSAENVEEVFNNTYDNKDYATDAIVRADIQLNKMESEIKKPICKVDANGTKSWYLNGELHREDGPAIEYVNGDKSWYLDGKCHREDGPAMEYANGDKHWYLDNKRHREDGPAIEYAHGDQYWYLNDKCHREDGPAREYSDGTKLWYINGKELTEDEFNKNYITMSEEVFTDMLEDEVETNNTAELKAENDVGTEDIEITDFHPGTVDNPFIYGAKAPELEKFILLNMFVAGKNATIQQKKLDQFIACVKKDIGEFAVDTLGVISAIHNTLTTQEMPDKIMGWLQEVKAGQYRRLCAGIIQACEGIGGGKINLTNCTRKQLLTIKGIGRKTSSMFLMYTRKDWRGACLDTHILKFLREEGGCPEAPLSTPSTLDMYTKYENKFIYLAQQAGKSIADYDFEIWSRYRSVPAQAPEEVAVI
jgi:thermostable 8-oxoguanine DNA glycosylase